MYRWKRSSRRKTQLRTYRRVYCRWVMRILEWVGIQALPSGRAIVPLFLSLQTSNRAVLVLITPLHSAALTVDVLRMK